MTPLAISGPAAGRSDVRLSCIAARDRERAEMFADKNGFRRAAQNYHAAVAAADVDLVYVGLPSFLHGRWARRAAEAGKHVFCEKPFAAHAQEADAVLSAAAARGVRVIEALHTRYHPCYRRLLRLVRRGALGRILRIEAYFDAPIPHPVAGAPPDIRRLPGGGAMADLGCYLIAWALDLAGGKGPVFPIGAEAEAALFSESVDESMTASLLFEGGIEAALSCSISPAKVRRSRLTVIGDEGTAVFDSPILPRDGDGLRVTARGRDLHMEPGPLSSYHHQMTALISALRTGRPLPTEGADILRRQVVLDRLYAAAGLGQARAAQ